MKEKSLLRALPVVAAGGRGNDGGREAAWGLLRGLQLSFLDGLKTQLEQKQEHET